MLAALITIAGLVVFETVSSLDNAIINADVLAGMGERARKWFLFWGMLIAVFLVRGILPWAIVYLVTPSLGPLEALTATFSSDPATAAAIAKSAPALLTGGGIFLLFLFFHWLFLEDKHVGLGFERFFTAQGVWFYAVVSLLLLGVVHFAMARDPAMAVAAVAGSSAFFIVHGFKANAAESERKLRHAAQSDLAKILYLEIIDATFSIDGVLGAFAFTMSVPLILLGNGIGAIVVRELTIRNVESVKKYRYLKNGAMYSILVLGAVMIAEGFGRHPPAWASPLATFACVGFFLAKSVAARRREAGDGSG